MGGAAFSTATLLHFARLVLDALGNGRDELDALNVYPIPDGDTGTNLLLTFEAGHAALEEVVAHHGGEDLVPVEAAAAAYSRGLLLGARGNSGVIMSQLVGAFLKRLGPAAGSEDGPVLADALAEALAEATAAAYAAVGDPVEGTVLSVARAAADAARDVAGSPAARAGTAAVASAVVRAAEEALARTTEQLPTLQRAGVVDAGGKGLCLVLAVAEAALTGRAAPRRPRLGTGPASQQAGPATQHAAPGSPVAGQPCPHEPLGVGPGYEVMYLLDADDAVIPVLRERLLTLGDSLVVVGGDGLWNVHVHVDDVGAAIEAGLACGRPHRVRVTHFRDQVQSHPPATSQAPGRTAPRAVVAVAFADGLARLFEQAGATVVRATAARPTTGQLLSAVRDTVRATGAQEVVLLSNDRDVVPAAEAAAGHAQQEDGTRVAVVPTRAQVQGLAALAVHEPARSFERDLVEMTAAARHARAGAVSVAVHAAATAAGPCVPGDVLGEVEGEVTVIGQDQEHVAVEVLDRLLGGGGELVTIVAGAGAADLARACEEHVRLHHPAVEVVGYDGGQERYPLLFGVE
jgi:uncharacterized protein